MLKDLVNNCLCEILTLESCSRCNNLPVEFDWALTHFCSLWDLFWIERSIHCARKFWTGHKLHVVILEMVSLLLIERAYFRHTNRSLFDVERVAKAFRKCTPQPVDADKCVLFRFDAYLRLFRSLRSFVLNIPRLLPYVISNILYLLIMAFEQSSVGYGCRLEGTLDDPFHDISFIHFNFIYLN